MLNFSHSHTRICKIEAIRIFCAIKYRLRNDPTPKKVFWFLLIKQLVQLTKKEYLVPDYMKDIEWEHLSNNSSSR